jgi:hypothetical protein
VTTDRGQHWVELGGGVPTIAFRDVEIQRRENDLVGASFGRGFYVLDDYSALRHLDALERETALFPVRDAWWYVPAVLTQAAGRPSMGSDDFAAANPPFGAIFTYYLRSERQTAKDERHDAEQTLREDGADVAFPGWERLRQEALEAEPKVLLVVRDSEGAVVRRIEGSAEAGLHRVAWDLRRPPPDPVDLEPVEFRPPWADDPQGPLAPPGRYTVALALLTRGRLETLTEPREFRVEPLPGFTLDEPDFAVVAEFQAATAELLRKGQGMAAELERGEERLTHIRAALVETPRAEARLFTRLSEIEASLAELRMRLVGDRILGRWNEASEPSLLRRVGQVAGGHWSTRQAPTQTQRRNLDLARLGLAELGADLKTLLETELPAFEAELEAAGAPWTPGRSIGEIGDTH